jgi:hypothetical protein
MERMRLNQINDSTFYIIQIIDSVKRWPSHIFIPASHRDKESPYYSKEFDSLNKVEDSVYNTFNKTTLFDTTNNNKTKLVYLRTGYEIDTLIYNTKKNTAISIFIHFTITNLLCMMRVIAYLYVIVLE